MKLIVAALLAVPPFAQHAPHKNPLCTTCPVPGIDSRASTSLGAARASGACTTHPAPNGFPLPDPNCTPGAFNPTVNAAQFGSRQFRTACVRDCLTDPAVKRKLYQRYGISRNASCELDHLVPLEMGGADSLDNIWPQCGNAPDGKNFKDIKDQVENYLAIQVLLGLEQTRARSGIAADWTQYIPEEEKFCATHSCSIGDYRK